MHNPVMDFLAFLTKPSYSEPFFLHFVYWVLAIASISVAIAAWSSVPGQRRGVHLWRFFMRFLIGSFWWEQSLWKFPTDTGGLLSWVQNEIHGSAFAIEGTLIKTLVLPVFQPFAYAVYGFEVLVAASLLLGFFTRAMSALGAVLIFSLFLGLYNQQGEWPWSYIFLLVIMITAAIDDYGLSLGLDAYIEARSPAAKRRRAAAVA